MRQAKRLFSKSNISLESSLSPSFRSKIQRDLPNDAKISYLGPGQYNIAFPIVKPKIQAIRKNNNTIIIKVNQKLSPVFQSIEPRFKQTNQKRHSYSVQQPQIYGLLPKKELISKNRQKKVSIDMKHRLQKLSQIFKNQTIFQGKSDTNNNDKIKRLSYDVSNEQVVNSLKLYKKEKERLHFLMKNMKNKNLTKGPSWSKYRQTKGNLYSINNVPGPGSYDEHHYVNLSHRYMETIDDKSWQFKSLTKRSSFGRLNQERAYQLYRPSHSNQAEEIDGKFYKVDSISLINKHEKSIENAEDL